MEPYQERVVAEREALDEKLTSLLAFFRLAGFFILSEEDQGLLRRQSEIMDSYLGVLDLRISKFK